MKNKADNLYKKDNDNFSSFTSDFLYQRLKDITHKKIVGKINIALSGGTTPLPILGLLKKEKLDWQRFNFFMVDERCVSTQNKSSNFGNIKTVFFDDISSKCFSMIQDNLSFIESVKKYKNTLINQIKINENGFPEFDLILLGMGADGHTASLFPKTKALLETNEIVVINKVPQLNTDRITLTYPIILSAKEIVIMMTGNKKKEIIDDVYKRKSNNYPICKIIQEHSNIKWLIG